MVQMPRFWELMYAVRPSNFKATWFIYSGPTHYLEEVQRWPI